MEQRQINLDAKFKACSKIRNSIQERVTNIDFLIKKIKNINKKNDEDINDFLIFIENLKVEKHGKQRNNHNFMVTFLKEKINSYDRIEYDYLDESLKNGKISYANNLAPKRIMSNYFFSNEIENILKVSELEESFRKFTTSESFLLEYNDCEKNNNIVENIRKYFALQLTRREVHLYNIIGLFYKEHSECKDRDLLDYLYIKYIYNSSLVSNYNNWLDYIGNGKISIYQQKYKNCLLTIKHEESKNLNLIEIIDYVDSNFAITEIHTFIVKDLFDCLEQKEFNECLIKNGLEALTQKDFEKMENIIVTIGSSSKLCYLTNAIIDPILFKKIDFAVHLLWDICMIKGKVLRNLLLKKDSELNNFDFFKSANIPEEVFERAKLLKSVFKLSSDMENKIRQ